MIETLISSKTRVKLLLKFFLNSQTTGYLRHLAGEFGESTNAIRQELNRFEEAGMLVSQADGNKKVFRANTAHPLFEEIHRILLKYVGLDKIIDHVVKRLGEVERVYLAGALAQGQDSPVIDLILVGDPERQYLVSLIEKAEDVVKRKIRYLIVSGPEYQAFPTDQRHAHLLLWQDLSLIND